MKKTVNKRQFENMIAECVQQALSESRQRNQKPARKVMNEAQMQRYIQNIINEELENEAWNGFKWGQDLLNAYRNGTSFRGERSMRQNQEADAQMNHAEKSQNAINGQQNALQGLEKYMKQYNINFPQITKAVEATKHNCKTN